MPTFSHKPAPWPRLCRLAAAALLLGMALAACAQSPLETAASTAVLAAPSPAADTPTPAQAASPTSQPTASPVPSATAAPTLTATPAGPRLCSPLAAAPIARLTEMVTNPYNPPVPGSDDPHQAIDLAVMLPGSRVAVSGETVQAALAGRVAGVIDNRFPYGSAILIETPLEAYPPEWWLPAAIPELAPTLVPRSALTCPPNPALVIPDTSQRSLYVLYAHLQQPPVLRPGEQVTCGQAIGQVGDTGNALNPHLHFEVRVGPSGMTLGSQAHYDASASAEEMSNYCLWRISGLFQLVDPNRLLELAP